MKNQHVYVDLFKHWHFILILSEYFLHCFSVLYYLAGRIEPYGSTKIPSLLPHMPNLRQKACTQTIAKCHPQVPILISLGKMECFLWLPWEKRINFQVKYDFILQLNPKPNKSRLFLQILLSYQDGYYNKREPPLEVIMNQTALLSLLRLKEDSYVKSD